MRRRCEKGELAKTGLSGQRWKSSTRWPMPFALLRQREVDRLRLRGRTPRAPLQGLYLWGGVGER